MKKHIQRIFTILAIILFFVITYYMGRPLISFVSEPGAFQVWVNEQGILGVLLFLGMLILQVFAAVIPGGPFEIAAGYAFGVVKGSLICAIGTTLGSMVVFFLVRCFGHKFLHLFVEEQELEKLTFLNDNKKMESILFLLFLIPGTPKDLLSYFVGLTDISVSHWLFICFVGRLPAIVLSVLGGHALSNAQYHIAVIAFVVILITASIGAYFFQKHKKNTREDPQK